MSIGHILFGFRGRIGVGTFWAGNLAISGAFAIVLVIFTQGDVQSIRLNDYLAALVQHPEEAPTELLLCLPFVIWLFVALQVKRLHDLSLSGWWVLFAFVPLLMSLVAIELAKAGVENDNAAYALIGLPFSLGSLLASLYSLWISIQMMFFPGDRVPNEYGAAAGELKNVAEQNDVDVVGRSSIPVRRGVSVAPAPPAPIVRSATVQSGRSPGFGRRGQPA